MSKYHRPLVTCLDEVSDNFVLTTADVGAILNIAPMTAGELLATGKIPGFFRAGRQLRILAGDLKKEIKRQQATREGPLQQLRKRVAS